MEILCVIPARSGSKGIPDKNITPILGKPLLAYSILAAKESRYISRIIVSTDSERYAEISRQYGAEVPFLRSSQMANDEIHAVYPVIECLQRLKDEEDYMADIVVMLLPTSPLRQTRHIDEAIEVYQSNLEGSVISVNKADKPPKYLRKLIKGKLYPYENKLTNPNFQRQEVETLYELNGSIYVTATENLIKEKTFHGSIVYPYIMEKRFAIDINEPFDLEIVELLMERMFKDGQAKKHMACRSLE